MKKHEIKVGGRYMARVSGNYVKVRVDAIREQTGWDRDTTLYDVTNLSTNRRTTFKSAAKFRSEVKDGLQVLPMTGTTVPVEEVISAEEAEENGTEQVNAIPAPAPKSLAVNIAQASARPAYRPADGVTLTPEQEAIIAIAREIEAARTTGQRVLVIGAGAGTGKTFTLKQLEQALSGNGQYTAFNTSLVAESKAKFQRAACNTTHSLAFRAVGRRFVHRLGGPRIRSHEIAMRLGITDQYVTLPAAVQPEKDGKSAVRRIKAAWLAGQVIATIRRFCMSDDTEVTERHIRKIDGLDEAGKYDNSNLVKAYLLPFVRKAWADLTSENGTLPFAHDVYVKLWQMGQGTDRPVIAADYILLDEAQDTAPVMLDILKQQKHALLILVGDDNQQIYEWRGAVNAMAAFAGAPRKLLSQSFRFGQSVADVANSVLATLEQPTDLVMKGFDAIPSRVCTVANPRCYLYRTNAGAIARLMRAKAEGKRGHLIGGSDEVVKFCEAAVDLIAGRGTQHPELGCFANWSEVQAYSKEDEGADLRLMVKLIDDFGAGEIKDALAGMPSEKDADLVLSTAHRSKGREWTSVKLGPDFPTANKLTDADRRLIYVAATRAQEELDISECPTFCGGLDKRMGPMGEENAWIPGLEIAYTAPMPTQADLDAYRAAKGTAKATAPAATAPSPVQTPTVPVAPTTPAQAAQNGQQAEVYTWANVNGDWCVRGPAERTGKRVTVTRKNGSTSQETLRTVAKKQDGNVWFYSIR